jgi:hypothetical protein
LQWELAVSFGQLTSNVISPRELVFDSAKTTKLSIFLRLREEFWHFSFFLQNSNKNFTLQLNKKSILPAEYSARRIEKRVALNTPLSLSLSLSLSGVTTLPKKSAPLGP